MTLDEQVDKWFADPKYGEEWQDTDLILLEVAPFSRLRDYLMDSLAPMSKKTEVMSALLEMLEHRCPRDGGADAAQLASDIRATIRQHADIAERALADVGVIKEIVLRSILGLPISTDYPQWMIDQARKEGA